MLKFKISASPPKVSCTDFQCTAAHLAPCGRTYPSAAGQSPVFSYAYVDGTNHEVVEDFSATPSLAIVGFPFFAARAKPPFA